MSRRIQLRSRTVEVENTQEPLVPEETRQIQSTARNPATSMSSSGSRRSRQSSGTVRALEDEWRKNEQLEELRRIRSELENQVRSIRHDIRQLELTNRIVASRQSEDAQSQNSGSMGWSQSSLSVVSGRSRMLRTRTWIAENTTGPHLEQQTDTSRIPSRVSRTCTWVVEGVPQPQKARTTPLAVDSWPSQVGTHTGKIEQQTPLLQPSAPVSSDDIRYMITRKNVSHELPEFNGDPTQWPLFKTMFDESTISARYSENENLLRLQKAVKGRAREYLGKLLYLPGGLPRVLARLETRYGRPELIVREVMKNVKAIPTMDDDLSRAEQVAGDVDNIVSTIRLVGKSEYLANPILLDSLLTKLSVSLRQQWGEFAVEMRGKPLDLGLFNDWLQDRIEAMGFMGETDAAGEEKSNEKASKLVVQSTRTSQCMLCDSVGHRQLEECPKFKKMSVGSRCQYVAEGLLCFLCLKRGHRSMVCRSGRACRTCKRRHHELLHTGNTENVAVHAGREGNDLITPRMMTNEPSCSTSAVAVSNSSRVFLRIAPVRLVGPTKTVDTFAFFDNGSTVTMIETELAEELGLKGIQKPLRVKWTDDSVREEPNSREVSVKIASRKEKAKDFHIYNARTVSQLNLLVQTMNVDNLSKRWAHLKDLEVTSYENAKPRLLIGEDNWPLTVPLKVVYGPWKGPVASKTRLGWVIHGNAPVNPNARVYDDEHHQATHWTSPEEEVVEDEISLQRLVGKFLAYEYLEDDYSKVKENNDEDRQARQIFDETTKKVGEKKWETGLLWKPNAILPNSKPTAIRRLKNVERRMDKDPVFAQTYCEKLNEFISKGYATKLEEHEQNITPDREFYLPHLGIINPNKPKKLRICFDAAAKTDGVSLNDALLKGPDLLVNLPGLLCKFREHPYAFGGDIKEMYPQILIKKEDQMAQKFLWRGMDRARPPDEYVMRVMTFGAKCSPFSAQEVKNRNGLTFAREYPQAVLAVLKNHYMDDYLDSVSSIETGIRRVHEVRQIHSHGGFTMCNWVSNSKEILKSIPQELRAESGEALCLDKEPKKEKLLGMGWRPDTDCLSLVIRTSRIGQDIITGKKKPTKREVLSHVMSLFDPLGLVALIGVEGKLLLQDVWKTEVKWEDEIGETENKKWQDWLTKLIKLEHLAIPRCYGSGLGDAVEIQLHLMCDASEKAYASVAYIRVEKPGGVEVSLAVARANVAPVKGSTIPRMELQAAVSATRIAQFATEEHRVEFHRVVYWSDSQVVLQWINSKSVKQLPIFVANRIREIHRASTPQDWRWVPTKLNCADDATRVTLNKTALEESRWLNGPSFLYQPEDEWPKQEIWLKSKEDEQWVAMQVETQTGEGETMPEIERFSNWYRLIRATAWVPRLATFLVKRDDSMRRELEPEELKEAERKWIRKAQKDAFAKEMEEIKTKKPLTKLSRLLDLNPFVDEDGILRIGGRLQHLKEVSVEITTPIILPPEHRLTRLLLEKYHKWAKHQGKETILNEIRQTYWILQARRAIQSTFNVVQSAKGGGQRDKRHRWQSFQWHGYCMGAGHSKLLV